MGTARWYRDITKDIVGKSTLYTDSTTLTVGAKLYNDLGEYTGMKVDTITSEGSFTAKAETVIITLTAYQMASSWDGSFEGTVNDIAFVSTSIATTTCEPNTFEVIKGRTCTITATNTDRGYGMILADENGNTLAFESKSFTYTFTPLEDCTFQIGSSTEK